MRVEFYETQYSNTNKTIAVLEEVLRTRYNIEGA
jgi:hypothetical protein